MDGWMDGWMGWDVGIWEFCEYGIELKHGLDFLDILYIPFFFTLPRDEGDLLEYFSLRVVYVLKIAS